MIDQKSVLSTEDVCRIIEASAKHGVLELKYQDLQVKFGKQPDPQEGTVALKPPVKAMTDQDHAEQTEKSLKEQELRLREEQLEELKVTDPVEFERMIRDGELEDDDADEPGEFDE